MTLVVPVFNEARRFNAGSFGAAMARRNGLSLIFVDDGSRDDTAALVRRFVDGLSGGARLVQLSKNMGKGEAVRQGLRAAIEDGAAIVGYWDADLATPLEELDALLAPLIRQPEVTIVLGSRVRLLGRHITRRPLRHYLGRGFATMASIVLRVPVYDTQCGAKLFRVTPALGRSLDAPFQSRWIFDVELLARLASQAPGSLDECAVEVPLHQWEDVSATHLGIMAFLRAPFELLNVYRVRARAGKTRQHRTESQP